jgi:hypothetical protein
MVITGDLNQTDITKENGLYDFITKVERYNETKLIKLVKFENEDIERSEIVKKVIEIYNFKKDVSLIENKKPVIKNIVPNITNTNTNITHIEPNISNFKSIKSYNISNNDAALIPKHHITHNFDIFFEAREF